MKRLLPALLIVASLALSACDSAEERAEKHYQAGLALLEQGDVDRALVEFRNVFDLNGKHKDARLTYARVERERGDLAEAYSQYLLLVEQYPDNLEARFALAEMAIARSDWPEAERHGREAAKLAPDDPLAQMFTVALDYQKAMANRDRMAAAAPADRAQALIDAHPDNAALMKIGLRLLIDRALNGIDPQTAMPLLDRVIALEPQNFDWQMVKLRLLVVAGDKAAVGAHLEAMYQSFPENASVDDLLIAWYMQNDDLDGAEAFLRRLSEAAAKAEGPDAAKALQIARMRVVQFLKTYRGMDAAVAEINALVALDPANPVYKAALAAADFEMGQQDKAIAALETLLKDAPDTADTRNIKVGLAGMLEKTGNLVGARARVEEVLTSDPSHIAALKMKARWLTAEDKPGDAIIALRTALDQEPNDPEILTLMAQAHERDGARDLAGERYAAAVEVSKKGIPESLRYASFLTKDGRTDPALVVIEDALSAHPDNIDLLATRADLLITLRQWDRATEAVADLRAQGKPAAIQAANRLNAKLLLRQEKVDETIQFLDSLTAGADADRAAAASVVAAQIQKGDVDAARTYLDKLLAESPTDPVLRFLSAGLFVLSDKADEAEKVYRALVAETPQDLRPFQALFKLLNANGRGDEANQLLDDALAKEPDNPGLNLMKANALERAEDWDGAIAIYEKLYAMNSNSLLVANNLATLLSIHRASDPASLDRAFTVANRLRGLDQPAFQDTYGWIAYLRGDFEEAKAALEPAAAALPKNVSVQIHLGLTYAALKQVDQARKVLEGALELAGADATGAEIDQARKALADLPAAGTTGP